MKEPVQQPPKKSKKKLRFKFSKEVVFLCSCCAAIIIFSLSTFNASFFLNRKVLGTSSQRATTQEEILYWQNLVAKYPNYLSGWVELAKLEIKSGDNKAALSYLDRAKEIDPNSSEVRNLESALNTTP